jgi:hypothetical protein
VLAIALSGCFLKPGPPGIAGEAGAGDDVPPGGGPDGRPPDGGSLDVTGSRANYVFVTSAPITLLGGAMANQNLNRADSLCNQSAVNAQLFGHYLAWMSDSTVSGAADRLRAKLARGWITPTNVPVADTVDDIVASPTRMFNTPRIDEHMVDAVASNPGLEVATGTDANGMGDIANSMCFSGSIRVGRPAALAGWTDATVELCSTTTLRVYCFGYDFNVHVP